MSVCGCQGRFHMHSADPVELHWLLKAPWGSGHVCVCFEITAKRTGHHPNKRRTGPAPDTRIPDSGFLGFPYASLWRPTNKSKYVLYNENIV